MKDEGVRVTQQVKDIRLVLERPLFAAAAAIPLVGATSQQFAESIERAAKFPQQIMVGEILWCALPVINQAAALAPAAGAKPDAKKIITIHDYNLELVDLSAEEDVLNARSVQVGNMAHILLEDMRQLQASLRKWPGGVSMHYKADAIEETLYQENLVRRLSTRGKVMIKEAAVLAKAAAAPTPATASPPTTPSTAASSTGPQGTGDNGAKKIAELAAQVQHLTSQVATQGRNGRGKDSKGKKGDKGKGKGKGKDKNKDTSDGYTEVGKGGRRNNRKRGK
jgi:hypothetical protein